MSKTLRATIYGLIAALLWAITALTNNYLFQLRGVFPAFTISSIYLIFGVIVTSFLIFLRRKRLQRLTRQDYLLLLGIALLFGINHIAPIIGFNDAISNSTNYFSFVLYSSPLFILAFSLIGGERPSLLRVLGIGLGVAATFVMFSMIAFKPDSNSLRLNLIFLVAALAWGGYTVLTHRASPRVDTAVITLVAFLGGCLFLIPAAIPEVQQLRINGDLGWSLRLVHPLGVVATIGAVWFWNRALAVTESTVAAVTFPAQLVFTLVINFVFRNEIFTSAYLIGSALVVLSIIVSQINLSSGAQLVQANVGRIPRVIGVGILVIGAIGLLVFPNVMSMSSLGIPQLPSDARQDLMDVLKLRGGEARAYTVVSAEHAPKPARHWNPLINSAVDMWCVVIDPPSEIRVVDQGNRQLRSFILYQTKTNGRWYVTDGIAIFQSDQKDFEDVGCTNYRN